MSTTIISRFIFSKKKVESFHTSIVTQNNVLDRIKKYKKKSSHLIHTNFKGKHNWKMSNQFLFECSGWDDQKLNNIFWIQGTFINDLITLKSHFHRNSIHPLGRTSFMNVHSPRGLMHLIFFQSRLKLKIKEIDEITSVWM